MSQRIPLDNSFFDDALGKHDAVALLGLLDRRVISVGELTEAAITRAEKADVHINGIAAKGYELARQRENILPDGLLKGIPFFMKDTEGVTGLAMSVGSHALPGDIQTNDSACAAHLLSTGVNVIGMSTSPEFGLTGVTESLRFGPSRNPWNLDYNVGGSSGGSAALVAAGVVPIASANDGAGSIRIPASCCGLVGLKPSQHRITPVKLPGFVPFNIFHQGIVSRSVRDTALFFQAVESYSGAQVKLPPIGLVQGPAKQRLRIALFVDDVNGHNCDSQCVSAAERAAKLCESLGHSVELIRNPFPQDYMQHFMLLWSMMPAYLSIFGKAEFGDKFDAAKFEPWTKYLRTHFFKNSWKSIASLRYLKKFQSHYASIFQKYDVLLSPTLGTPPPRNGYLSPSIEGSLHWQRLLKFIPFTPFQNAAEAPAITLPLATSAEGLPIGIQFAAAHGQDRMLLELAFEIEEASPWQQFSSG